MWYCSLCLEHTFALYLYWASEFQLLINSKNHTHVKVGHISEFLFGIYWWTWKTNICRPKKKQNNFTIYNVAFFKKNKEKHLEIALSKTWWYNLQFLRYSKKQTEIDNFSSLLALFTPFKTPQKTKFWKKIAGDTIIILHMPITLWSYDARFLRYGVRQTKIFVILGHFLLFYPPNDPKNQNSEMKKKCLEILSF